MNWHSYSQQELLDEMGADPSRGLSEQEAAARTARYGPNLLTKGKKIPLILRFLGQLKDFMILTLIGAALVSLLASYCNHELDLVEPAIILGIVLLNALLGLIQESRAEHAIEALQDMVSPTARVLRQGSWKEIPARELVPGDIVSLESGGFVPADIRLLSASHLMTDESSLTGESHNVEKVPIDQLPEHTPLGDQKNMVFSSTLVTSGHGEGMVAATGMDTQVGHIASLMLQDSVPLTPLQKRLAGTGRLLCIGALVICVIIFLMGVARGIPIFHMFMTSISLSVAAIPEGLQAVVTIMLSLGVQRMARQNAVIRRLPVVETLGSATVICSDKTGTLTRNQMQVAGSWPEESRQLLLTYGTLCSNVSVQGASVTGSGTETAIVHAAMENGLSPEQLSSRYPRLNEIPFDSVRKRMTTLHRTPTGGYLLIVKGAVDYLLPLCASGKGPSSRTVLAANQKLASQSLRMIGVCFREFPVCPAGSLAALEKDLTFLGLLGLKDPPRPEVFRSIAQCKTAGILPVMITGDHPDTAIAIGKELNILSSEKEAVTGAALSRMTEEELVSSIEQYRVFARVTPEHKVSIVKAFQKRGHIVAMTGDGVNDAPALKRADIGCAMGKKGTDVAKNAADMVLLDDNFATIVSAVREGRGIYDNIEKSVHFLLSCNIGEIITIFVAILLGWPSPLVAVQLLWVNLVTDSLPAIALGLEPPEKDIMYRPPVRPGSSFFGNGLWLKIILEGLLIGGLALTAFLLGTSYSLDVGRTMAFAVLSLSQLFHSFNMRSHKSLFRLNPLGNVKLILSFFLCCFLQIIVISSPSLAALFHVIPLNGAQWKTVCFLSALPIFFCEAVKNLLPSRKS